MGSILIIKNDYEFDPELLKRLEQDYRIHFSKDAWDALDIISENYIDIFAIISNDHHEASIEDFFRELEATRSDATPIILISEKPSKDLQSKAHQKGWYLIGYPINHQHFISAIKRSTIIANALDDRIIILEKRGHKYPYKIRNISRIQRTKNRYIKVYSRNAITLVEEEEEFFYEHPLYEFPKHYDIEGQIKQAQQSWLVNVSEIKEIRITDTELVLHSGVVVPTSKNYIKNFIRQK